jgi:hypothetical protein
MQDLANALPEVPSTAALNAERKEATEALRQKRAREHELHRAETVKKLKLLHTSVWDQMRPEDRESFVRLKEHYNKTGKVSLKELCDPSVFLVPGAAKADTSVHALLVAQRSLALFAKSVHAATVPYLDDLRQFVAQLEQANGVSAAVKAEAAKHVEHLTAVVDAVDIRMHLHGLEFEPVLASTSSVLEGSS